MKKQHLIFAFVAFLSLPTFAAEIFDIDGKDAIIESADDEVFNVGDYLFVLNKKGKRKAVLKVINDRGTLYDTKVIYGKARAGYEVTEMTARQKKKMLAFIKKKKGKKRKKKRRRVEVADVEEQSEDDERPTEEGEEARDAVDEEIEKSKGTNGKTINISLDLIPFLGDTLGVNLLNGSIEYRWNDSLSVGLTGTFGDINFEGTAPAGGFPTISYLGFGAIGHYSFSGDVYGNGFYGSGYIQFVKEDWTSTTSFPGLNESGYFAGLTAGYQYWIGGLNIRAGLKLNYSTLGTNVVSNGFNYARDSTTTGTSFQPVLLVGYAF